jgi:hypothetical protein
MIPAGRGRAAPAAIRRAFFVGLLGAAISAFGGPPSSPPPPNFGPIGPADRAAAEAILDRFREGGVARPYYFEFQLRQIPRRGDERVFSGRLWGARDEQGLILRLALTDADGREHRFLLLNGPRAKGWSFAAGRIESLDVRAWFQPLVEGVEVTPFDIQMPFLSWPDVRLVKLTRILGRPANEFLFRPPPAVAAGHPELAGVRAYLDTQFDQPVQTELLGADGRVRQTLSLVDLKKIGKQWIPKEVDVRNEATRDKTRIYVTAAALGLDLSPALFSPEGLAEDVAAPPEKLIARLPP